MNRVTLIGRLTKDMEVRTSESGNTIGVFTIAVNRPYKKEDGQSESDFINCIAFNKKAETMEKYCKKGSQIGLEGRIQTRTYDAKDGTKRYITEVLVENFYLLGSKPEKKEPTDSQIVQAVMNDEDPFVSFGNEVVIDESELPF